MDITSDLPQLVKMYREQKEFADKLNARVDEIKQELIKRVQEEGFVDDKGNQWLDSGDFQLKRERRVSVSFNEHFAEDWAKKKGVWDQVKEVREFVSEDQILAVAWDDEEMKHDLDNFYTRRENFAFKVVEGKSYEED
jgi:hypothetical protein